MDEVFLVLEADAVVDPDAVVVHAGDAALAVGAVVGAGWFDGAAFLAVVVEG